MKEIKLNGCEPTSTKRIPLPINLLNLKCCADLLFLSFVSSGIPAHSSLSTNKILPIKFFLINCLASLTRS